ncbi:DUF5999 family protein [Actinoplanes sp. NPDC024001]|uniref:DUF5999 family protein n=1 Tax=Actinoplanes sp. NPDC024001 TaxID=3154598 RepID=UPI0033C81BCF
MCEHQPSCPSIDQPGWDTARVVAAHSDLGWSILCNGAVVIGDAVTHAPIDLAGRRRTARSRRTSPMTAALPLAA